MLQEEKEALERQEKEAQIAAEKYKQEMLKKKEEEDQSSSLTTTYRGIKRLYAYKTAETIVTHVKAAADDSGKRIRYRFNETGNVESVRDDLGFARFVRYDSSFENKPEDISSLQRTLSNLGRKPDYSSGWTVSGKRFPTITPPPRKSRCTTSRSATSFISSTGNTTRSV